MIKKIKVVWICNFSNKEVRNRLPLSNMKLHNIVRSFIGKGKNHGYADFTPWVTNLIREFEKFEDIELHVLAPFKGLKLFTCEFEMRGVFYHFYQADLPILHLSLPKDFFWRSKSRFFFTRFVVNRFLKNIKPDIVNLIGTENPYYSIAVLDIKNIPVYVSTQTVYSNPVRKKYTDQCLKLNWDMELMIHKKEKYYGCTGRMHRDLIMLNNSNAIIFKMFFPIEKPKPVKDLPKIYDFVCFSGIGKKKGTEDLLETLAIVKKERNDVSLNIIGKCSVSYMNFLLKRINDLGLVGNIEFTKYFPVHSDLHQHVVQSLFAVLPIKLDIIPGSVVEAMLLELPLVTYKTTGTPYLNKDGETVLLADIGDIYMLAKQMLKLLNSPSLAKKLSKNAKAFVERVFDNTTSAKRLVSNYKAVIEHYNNNNSIPEEQLFNINEFPLY